MKALSLVPSFDWLLSYRAMRLFRCFLTALLAIAAVRGVSGEPTIELFAGDGSAEFRGDGANATETGLGAPSSLALDSEGRVLFADAEQGRVLRVAEDGTLSTLAGTGFSGFSGDGGPATEAFFSRPTGISVDSKGWLYLADRMNHRIRRIGPEGIVETVVGDGSGMFGLGTFSGEGAPGIQAALNFPTATLVQPDGSLLIADQMNGRVRKLDPQGLLTTVAGGNVKQHLDLKEPVDLAHDASGQLLIVDSRGGRIWAASGENDFQLLIGARPNPSVVPLHPNILLERPVAVAVPTGGGFLWAETGGNRVCWITPDGRLEILMKGPKPAGKGAASAVSTSKSPVLGTPADLLCLPDGSVLVADSGARRIWKISNLN